MSTCLHTCTTPATCQSNHRCACVAYTTDEITKICKGRCGSYKSKCNKYIKQCPQPVLCITKAGFRQNYCFISGKNKFGTCIGCTNVYQYNMVNKKPFEWVCSKNFDDGIEDVDETDVDCGGLSNPIRCNPGKCTNGICTFGKIGKSCVLDNNCAQSCIKSSDCVSKSCVNNKCMNTKYTYRKCDNVGNGKFFCSYDSYGDEHMPEFDKNCASINPLKSVFIINTDFNAIYRLNKDGCIKYTNTEFCCPENAKLVP